MWFRALSLVIAVALLAKASIALAMPRRFYTERQRQYASASAPVDVLVRLVIDLAAVGWCRWR